MGVVKTMASVLPDNQLASSYRTMQQLFDTGNSSYEAYERIAVQHELSAITKPALKTDQWYKQDGGYFVRYFPASYQQVKIQVTCQQAVRIPPGTLAMLCCLTPPP
jgi:hypothetical protein